jgi:glutamate synthase domain-containing protein 2
MPTTWRLSIDEALPRVVDSLIESNLRHRVRLIAAGKLLTPARAAWALSAGADFVNTARGFMFALGCIQALRCHANTCPTGITTHNERLQRGLVVEDKAERVAYYCANMNKEIDMIAHSCGCCMRANSAGNMCASFRPPGRAWR